MFKVNNKDTCSSVSIVNFEYVIADWALSHVCKKFYSKNPKYAFALEEVEVAKNNNNRY